MIDFETLREAVYAQPPGVSLEVPKSEMPALPQEFEPTTLGTPLWIAHPGATSQSRAPDALHAYEVGNVWMIHRDQCDPKKDPIGHAFRDAPELPIAAIVAGIASVGTYLSLDQWDARKTEEDGRDRPAWVRVALAAAVFIGVFLVTYILGALVRVGLGVT
jgi:hypothetical protein